MCHQPMVAYTWLLHQLLPGIFLLPFPLASIFHLLPFPPSLLPTTVSQLCFPQLHHSTRLCCWNSQFLTTTTTKKCQWFLYSSSPLFAPSGGVGSREGGLGPQTSLHLWPKLLLLGEHGCISVHAVWTKFHLVVTLRMGFSTKLVAASANLSFLPYSGFSRPLYFSSNVPERSCRAEAE